jgi:N-[(2S)-2-amino-2-carboxyethyl]-L-glutamate dehydrogenase
MKKSAWRSANQPHYVTSDTIKGIILSHRREIIDLVAETYRCFYDGDAVNPDTYSMKFPQKPNSRINALPAYVGQKVDMAGMKWVASFPDNVKKNRQRASAVIILNSFETGYPIALLDGTLISSARTAASAALAARCLIPSKSADSFALYGAGVINRDVLDFLVDDGWSMRTIQISDPNFESRLALAEHCRARGCLNVETEEIEDPNSHDLVSMATSALTPWFDSEIGSHQTILHISLRDIVPKHLNSVRNIVDDVHHAVKANTSLHLLEQEAGRIPRIEDFGNLLTGKTQKREATVVAAFGMGILDIAVANLIMDIAGSTNELLEIEGMLPNLSRW